MTEKFDSIIFDMDGTLWDAVDSYCEVWNVSFAECGINHAPITRDQLMATMGMTIDKIMNVLTPEVANDKNFYECLVKNEQILMPKLGGKLYPGVKEDIALLAEKYQLFMVSNCAEGGLPNFLHFTGLTPYFIDTLSNGQTHLDKAGNINCLRDKYRLEAPLYVGDTQGDADACLKAGVPIAWASYGFGEIKEPDYTLSCFHDLKNLLL